MLHNGRSHVDRQVLQLDLIVVHIIEEDLKGNECDLHGVLILNVLSDLVAGPCTLCRFHETDKTFHQDIPIILLETLKEARHVALEDNMFRITLAATCFYEGLAVAPESQFDRLLFQFKRPALCII